MKVYTKRGDTGLTDLIGGTRVNKADSRLEAYGTADELNSFVGLLRAQPINPNYDEILNNIQNTLFTIGANLATDQTKIEIGDYAKITEEKVKKLEQAIDQMEQEIPPLRQFILPSGNQTIALAHVCRTITRRLERNIINLNNQLNNIDPMVLKYVNRLSDYFFVLAKKITLDDHCEYNFWKK